MEKDCGIEVYLTAEQGIGGKLRKRAEEFVVDELGDPPPRVEGGSFTAARIRSVNWETNRLVREMARRLRISRKRIGFAGTKDKRAVATRWFTFEMPSEEISALRLADVVVLDAYPTDRPLELGDLWGNAFDITVRELAVDAERARELVEAVASQLERVHGFPNFFGVQRFGALRPVTHLVGRAIVEGDFAAAVNTYVSHPAVTEDEDVAGARAAFARTGDAAQALRAYPKTLGFEKAVLHHLAVRPEDHVGALNQLPLNLRMMFVHAYQAYLFNRIVSERILRGMPLHEPVQGDIVVPFDEEGRPDRDRVIHVTTDNLDVVTRRARERKALVTAPLPGTDTPMAGGAMGDIEAKILEEERVRPAAFFVPDMPDVSSKGARREILCPLDRLDREVGQDGARFQFRLPRGAYATSLLREFMKAEAPAY